MDYQNVTPELMEKAKARKSADELFAPAKTQGLELSKEQLDAVAA